jgi:hypothetical protein
MARGRPEISILETNPEELLVILGQGVLLGTTLRTTRSEGLVDGAGQTGHTEHLTMGPGALPLSSHQVSCHHELGPMCPAAELDSKVSRTIRKRGFPGTRATGFDFTMSFSCHVALQFTYPEAHSVYEGLYGAGSLSQLSPKGTITSPPWPRSLSVKHSAQGSSKQSESLVHVPHI